MPTCKECSKPATYAFKQKELLYCTKHGKEKGAKPFRQVCLCGNAMPNFGIEGDEYPSGCSKCKTDVMIDIRHKRCKECSKRPSYGVKGTTTVEYCAEHKKEKMVDLVNKVCETGDCPLLACFGTEWKKPLHCFEHKKEGMMNVNYNRCFTKDCKGTAVYGLIKSKPTHCSSCKTTDMKNVVSRRCELCDRLPTFGLVAGHATHCLEHKSAEMSDFKHKICEFESCDVRACYGFEENKLLRCFEHRLEGMENITGKKCSFKGCRKRSTFGYEGSSEQFCKEHKKVDMIDLYHKICKECSTRANFGFKGKEAEYCSTHKKEDMVDLANKMCEEKDCIKNPSYGYDKKRLRCAEHKLTDMKDIAHASCQFKDCPLQCTFGKEGGPATHCASHKDADMIDVIKDTCPGVEGLKGPDGLCPFGTKGTKKYDMYCMKCFVQGFPDDPRTALARKNTHELVVRDYLNKEFPELKLVHDKPLWTHNCECTHRRRVDLRTLIGATMLAIEVDENQHTSKDEKDEELRYDDLYMLYSGKWVYIRYNPDSFMDEKGKRRNPLKEKRLQLLKETIQTLVKKIQEEKNTDLVEIHKLFYNATVSSATVSNTLSII